jgi:hypothetical protein
LLEKIGGKIMNNYKGIEIKPCPFCGNICELIEKTQIWIECTQCFYSSKEFDTEEEAIAAHNVISAAIEFQDLYYMKHKEEELEYTEEWKRKHGD